MKKQNGKIIIKAAYYSIPALLFLSACASTYQPVVDMKGVKAEKYQRDLMECRNYAMQVDPANQAIAGALIGAALGAALTGSIDDSYALSGAGTGAVAGAAAGVGKGAQDQVTIINNCMRGRHYKVLN